MNESKVSVNELRSLSCLL